MSLPNTILAQLRRIVGDDGVVCEPEELSVYESDAFSVARGAPRAVVLPTDTQQVSAVVKLLRRHDLPIVPRGSGTGVAGGAVAFGGGVLLATNRMTRIESIDLENRVGVVQAGVINLALCRAVAGRGWHFSSDPSSEGASTIGGNVATNAATTPS